MKMLYSLTAVLLFVWTGWGLYVIVTTEQPEYEVVQSLSSNVEIRQYGEQTWISTQHTTDDVSFPVLASYIFGRNLENKKVSMTAPVVTDDRMSFILPKGYSRETAPTPDGQPIEFTTVPARQLATIEFSWLTTRSRVEEQTNQLLDMLQKNGIATKGHPRLMRYNDPWTPPFLRRNEVAIQVE